MKYEVKYKILILFHEYQFAECTCTLLYYLSNIVRVMQMMKIRNFICPFKKGKIMESGLLLLKTASRKGKDGRATPF